MRRMLLLLVVFLPGPLTLFGLTCRASAPAVPRVLTIGSRHCFACQFMEPLRQRLAEEYRGRVDFVFVDVASDPEPARIFRLRRLPTTIFFDGSLTEIFRLEGPLDHETMARAVERLLAAQSPPPLRPAKVPDRMPAGPGPGLP